MIRNRLAELLSERGLKITRVAKETGISRNTITATAQNDSKMIQLETINTLCKYLAVTPNDFFQYVPIDLEYHIEITSRSTLRGASKISNAQNYPLLNFTFDLFIDCDYYGKKKTFELEGELIRAEIIGMDGDFYLVFSIVFSNEIDRSDFREIEKKIPAGFHVGIKNEVERLVEDTFNNYLDENLRAEAHYDLYRFPTIAEYESEILPFNYT